MGRETEPLPDQLRCKRTDGRQWRCSRRVVEGKKLCEIHHLQGRHRQHKLKVPEALKLQRKARKARAIAGAAEIRARREGSASKSVKLKRKKPISGGESNSPENATASSKKRKIKGGNLQLELMRMVLKREEEKRNKQKSKKKKKEEKEKESVTEEIKSHNGDDFEVSSNSEGELMKNLPYGLMAISPASHYGGNVGGGSCSSPCDVKIGADMSVVPGGCFRSKNIEPVPIGKLQVLPYRKDVGRLRKGKTMKCHWCRRSGFKTLIRCSSRRKEFYCMDCIKDQNFDTEEEVKMACPVCRGTCRCKGCSASKHQDDECEGFSKDKNRVDMVLHFHYLICMLLPVLKKINQDETVEVEVEAKLKGEHPSEVPIQQAGVSCSKQCCCSTCKTSIVNVHRRCPKCSYNLCLSCCQDVFQRILPSSAKALLHKCPGGRNPYICGKQLPEVKSMCYCKRSYGSKKYPCSSTLSPRWTPNGNGSIPCPPAEFGGCGYGILNLSCIFPLSWSKELEKRAEELVSCYELPETLDVFSCCSFCLGMNHEAKENKQLQEAAAREDANDNYLYYPTIADIHSDNFEHFQKHWGIGQPVIIRNVLRGTSDLSWDPIVMFCTYLKNTAAKTENEQPASFLDWFEVEIDIRQIVMGSFKIPTHANMWHERLKLKGWLSSHLFQEHFPGHHAEILRALPLPEYMDPKSGILNVAVELPQEISRPDLGPYVYITHGSGENIVQADSVTKLRYDSYDVVNILAHTSDAPVSSEQLNYIRKLMKKHQEQNKVGGEAFLDSQSMEGVGLHDMVGKEMHLHKNVARVSWFSAASHQTHDMSPRDRDMLYDGEYDTESDSDTDTDTEVSKFFFGPLKTCRASENIKFCQKHSDNNYREKKFAETCGAQWDVFRRQDVPKLVEYLRRYSKEFTPTYGMRKHMVHPILDQNFFLDKNHKMRLKEEFKIEPWTFVQHVGEAVIIPAGCPYQVRNLKSCVNVVLDFVSPENVAQCIDLIDELRLLPVNHKVKLDSLEVKKMALYSISRAIKEIRGLTCAE